MPLISVVIPVHGVEDYLDRCLDSVLRDSVPGETAPSLEVITVDDASPDGCGAILAARQDPRLRVISTPAAVGPGPARDLGAKEATGSTSGSWTGTTNWRRGRWRRWPGR